MKKLYTLLILAASLPTLVYPQQNEQKDCEVKVRTKKINRLLPDYAKVQYAGGIGYISIGLGYESKKKKFQGDFMYGYVPESVGGIDIHSVTSKLTWLPVRILHGKKVTINPITAGILVNYAFGKQYFLFSPDKYPYNYYNFPTAMHVGIFVGGSMAVKQFGIYYELGSTDKELLSYVGNSKALAFSDILNLAAGFRYSFN